MKILPKKENVMKKSIIGVLVVLLILGLSGWAQAASTTTSADYITSGSITLSMIDDELTLTGNSINFFANSNLGLAPTSNYDYSLSFELDLGYSFKYLGFIPVSGSKDISSYDVELGIYPGVDKLNELTNYNQFFTLDASGLSFSLNMTELEELLTLLGVDTTLISKLNFLSGYLSSLGSITLTPTATSPLLRLQCPPRQLSGSWVPHCLA